MTLAMPHAGRNAGVTVAEINLKLIWDVITGLRIGQGGYAYVVDRHGRLIAHSDISLVLRNTDLSPLPQVAASFAPVAGNSSDTRAGTTAVDLFGRPVLTAHASISPPGWLVLLTCRCTTPTRRFTARLGDPGLSWHLAFSEQASPRSFLHDG